MAEFERSLAKIDRMKDGYQTTRRGLIAAGAVLGAMMAARKANAYARPPLEGEGGEPAHNCFLRGTRILTPKGEVKVEDLAAGDLVTTIDGTAKPIKWIGSWTYATPFVERWPGDVLPVKVSRSALDRLVPHSDLFLSAYHSLYIDGLLIPVRNLVNGRSIVHCTSIGAASVEYFHIELMTHDVIFSEGAPAETLLAAHGYADLGIFQDDQLPELSAHCDQPRAFAPRVPANRSAVIGSRLRSAVSPLIDIRQPGDAIWQRLAERAETQLGV